MKARIKFEKGGVLRYVGHLDMMRYFQKAIRRSGIPISYSQGFHPHQHMSFAMPLGVGVSSEGEYMDIDLEEEINPNKTVDDLNSHMADGVRVISFRYLTEEDGNAMSSVGAASYFLYLKGGEGLDGDLLMSYKNERFDGKDKMLITKKTKKSEREIDLKPFVYDFRLFKLDEDYSKKMQSLIPDYETNDFRLNTGDMGIYLLLSAGSEENIRPDLFMKYLTGRKEDWEYLPFGIHRIDLLKKDKDGGFVSL